MPLLQCHYPCAACTEDKHNCTACWQHDEFNPRYFMQWPQQSIGRCERQCDFGWTSNGTPNRKCQRCDSSCVGCLDNGKANDTLECITCAELHPYRLENTNFCLSSCYEGIFEMGQFVCGVCDKPCKSCVGTRSKCTGCDPDSNLAFLYQDTCINSCPIRTTPVANECHDCISPCEECSVTASTCISCDGTDARKILMQNKCYNTCPVGYATDYENLAK